MALMIILVIIPGILINRWLTAKEKAKQRRGFEVKLNTGEMPVPRESERSRTNRNA